MRDKQAVIFYGDGRQECDFVYVDEVVRNVFLVSEKLQAAGLAIYVFSGETVSIINLAETLSSILSEAPAPQFEPPRAGDIDLSQGNPSRAEQVLGFRAQISLAEGLAETVERMQT
jgi:UDP-glucose 4-epimerase